MNNVLLPVLILLCLVFVIKCQRCQSTATQDYGNFITYVVTGSGNKSQCSGPGYSGYCYNTPIGKSATGCVYGWTSQSGEILIEYF